MANDISCNNKAFASWDSTSSGDSWLLVKLRHHLTDTCWRMMTSWHRNFFFFFFKLFAAQLLSSWWFDTPQCSCDVTVIWKIASLKTKLFVDADLASTTVWTSSYWSPYTPGEKHSFELSNSWILIHGNPFKSFKMFCHFTETLINLTHWGRVTHICVRKLDQHCSR